MNHLDKWERQRGHRYEWAPGEIPLDRNVRAPRGLVCEYEGCGRVCKSKAGLVAHQRRIHRPAENRVQFFCSKCSRLCEMARAKVNHEMACNGGLDEAGNRRQCGTCGEWITRDNFAQHRRMCNERHGKGEGEEQQVREGRGRGMGRVKECDRCGQMLSASNMARHQNSC